MRTLLDMLTYRRKAGSRSHLAFCARFLEPVFGPPDRHGNYVRIVGGGNQRIAFMSHHDSVHRINGMQKISVTDGVVGLSAAEKESNCLGADCATGVWIMLEMIKAGKPGVYVVHADEESGGQGASALLKDFPDWLQFIDAAISLDRYGKTSIITDQMGADTCSEEFAHSLDEALGGGFKTDPTGSFTDSAVYEGVIPECTNLSVGYYAQHTVKETQCLRFAGYLAERMIRANFDDLIIARDPRAPRSSYGSWGVSDRPSDRDAFEDLSRIVYNNPDDVAAYLFEMGVTAQDIEDYLFMPYDR